MSDHSGFDFLRFRDGLGAARRRRDARALDPDYFKLDERSLRDLLEFAREFAGTLLYYNPFNQVAGSWSAFLESDPDEMIAFLKDPAFFDDQPQKKAQFSQPHFVLFLTFLALLKQAQAQMNGITRRHLDFYYQQALGLQNKPGRPDQAHVLAQLEPEEDQIFIPKGTLLFAGEDAEGDPILYQVDRELLANQAQIGPKMSLHVEKETTTLAGIREFEKDTGEPEKVLLQLFNMAYRREGTEKDARPFPEGPAPDRELDLDLIADLDALAGFIENKLHLRITVFQHLLELFQAWENPLNWHRDGKEELTEEVNGKERAVRGGGMNDYLSKAAKRRNDQFEFSIEQLKDKDFDKNIQAALGVDINGDPVVWNGNVFVPDSSRRNAFIELDGITNFYNLYHTYLRLREEKNFEDHPVYQKIKEFGFEQTPQSTPQNGDEQGTTVQEKNIDEFGSMMKLRLDVLERLKEIIRILSDGMRQAGETPGPANHLEYHPNYTFSDLFMKVCKLGIDDLKFRGWDKGFLRISIPGISVPITEIMDEWPDHFRGEGFMLEAHLENDDDNTKTISSINAALTRELYAHLRTNHPTHFLEIKYGGTAAQSKTTVVLDQNFPQPIGFEVADAAGLLTVKLKQPRNLASELMEAWNKHAQKGNFEIGAITPTVVFDSQKDELILKGRDKDGEEETYKLDKETILDQIFAARLPAGKPDKYLKIVFTGPAGKAPKVEIQQDESQADPVRFEMPKDDLLKIKVRDEQTSSGVLLNAWKKNRRKGRFVLEYIGLGTVGISKTAAGAPLDLEPEQEWFCQVTSDQTNNFLKITYTGLASTPKVEIAANDKTEDPPVNFENDLASGHLSIKLKQEKTTLEEIFNAWQKQSSKVKIAFALETIGTASGSANISKSDLPINPDMEKLNRCSIQLPEKDPVKCLRVAYAGPATSAMVKIEVDSTFSNPIDFPFNGSAGQLIIRLKNDETPLSAILNEWEKRTFSQKNGFELAYTPELAVFDSEIDPTRRLSKEISLTKRYSMDFPADQAGDKNFLRIRYTGEFSAPKVKLATHVKTPSGAPIPDVAFDLTYEEISVTDQGGTEIREVFPDEYFKIKGIQLAQVESYFRMQAEDFFFIRDLFKMELGEDWRYKDPAWQWRRADELLENAHRDLFGAEAKPEIISWKNLYVAPEADLALAPSFSEEEEFLHWKTFGKPPNPEIPGEAEIIKTGDLGFVITSPALRLTEGRRQLALTLTFEDRGFVVERLKAFWGSSEKDPDSDAPPAEEDSDAHPIYPFRVEASTEKGWIGVPDKDWKKFVIGEGTIEITLSLPIGFEPLAPVAEDPLSGPWPALKFILEREKIDFYDNSSGFSILKESRRPYELLRELYLSSVSVVATVEGLKNLRVQNLQGDIDPQKPFEPFGPEPAVGDRLYITHPELIAQRLETVTLKAVWNNLPKNGLGAYYESYSILGAHLKLPVPQLDNGKFTVEMALRDAHHQFAMTSPSGETRHKLFPPAAGQTENDLSAAIPPDQTFAPGISYVRQPVPSQGIPADILKADRYIELKLLSPDFQHRRFAELLNLQALAGSPDGVLFETRKVEAVQGTAVKIVQLQGVLAQGLPIEDFTVEYKATTVAEAQAVATAAVEAATASAQAALAGVNTVVTQVKGIAQKVGLQAVDVVPSTIVATAQQIAQEAAKALVEAEKKAAEALADAEGGESNAEDAAPVTITGAAVAEATKTKIEAEDAARKAVVAAAEKQRADKALLDAEAKKATLDGAGDDPKAVEGEVIPLTVTYHDEANSQLRVPDNLPVDMELVISYPGPLLLPDPFTPVMDHISVDYTTSVTVALPGRERTFFADDPPPGVQPIAAAEKTDDRLLHLHPFGVSDLGKSGRWMKIDEDADNGTVTEKLFFRLAPRYEDEGELYLGVENLQPPQSLSLLFQMAEGSSNPDLPVASVEWACLSGDDWTELKGEQILQDTTNGLQNSGIIELALPATASREHTRMPAGIHWLRLRVNRYSASLNNTIDIHTQALRATWLDQGPAAGRLEHTLPAGSIVEPNEPIPGLLDFLQPYSSFGGKAMEQTDTFYLRSSERLRHKKRAVTMWDYERLVLEQFPDIYKVKALAADLLEVGASPGQVAVIVIPDIRFRRPFDPFEPKVPQRQLAEIQQFLQDLAPPFAWVQVQNPRFDYLHVRAAVRFHDMNNFNFYADQLQRELKQFLSPWAFDQSAEITFGRDIYLSMVVHFMETRPYVDFIDQPKLILKERLASDGSLRPIKGDAEAFGPGGVARMRGPDVILVTTPDHTIEFLDDSIDPRKRILSGIGYAKLDLDFKVAKNKEDNPS